MNRTRKRRLIIVSLTLLAVAVAASLSVFALQKNITYLYSPSEVMAGKAPAQARFRLGGVVKKGSVRHDPDSLTVNFIVTDRFHDMPVAYTGILPDLFRAGQSVITEGHMDHGRFAASTVLAKHDSTYMPPEVADAIRKAEDAGRAREAGHGDAGSRSENGTRDPGLGTRGGNGTRSDIGPRGPEPGTRHGQPRTQDSTYSAKGGPHDD